MKGTTMTYTAIYDDGADSIRLYADSEDEAVAKMEAWIDIHYREKGWRKVWTAHLLGELKRWPMEMHKVPKSEASKVSVWERQADYPLAGAQAGYDQVKFGFIVVSDEPIPGEV